MRQTLALAIALALVGCASPQAPPSDGGFVGPDVPPGEFATSGAHSRVLVAGALREAPPVVTSIPSALDGALIQVAYVLPETDEPVPVVFVHSPYFIDLRTVALRDAHPNYPAQMPALLLDELVPRGYAVAFVAARGTGGSGGCYGWWSPDERADLAQAVAWLAKQPWSTGALAAVGLSMDGAGAWMAAGSGDAGVRTIVPIGSQPDLRSFFVRNGTPTVGNSLVGTTAFWGAYSLAPMTTPISHGRDPTLAVPAALCEDAARGLANGATAATTGANDSFAFYEARDLRPAVEERYHGSVLLVHGLNDPLAQPHLVEPWVASLETRGLVVKRLLGQWGHDLPDDPTPSNPTVRWDFAETLVRWLDHELKGLPAELGARVHVADSTHAWRREDTWPPSGAAWREMHVLPTGLSDTDGERGSVLLEPDPARLLLPLDARDTTCPRCALFASEPFPDGLRFAGLPQLPLTVTPLGEGGHVTALLYVEDANATRKLVGAAQMDLRFADGGDTPKPVMPGQPLRAMMEAEPLDVRVPPGGRLVLALTQGGYGGAPPDEAGSALPTFGGYYRTSSAPAAVRVELGGGASTLRILTFERGADAFFSPP